MNAGFANPAVPRRYPSAEPLAPEAAPTLDPPRLPHPPALPALRSCWPAGRLRQAPAPLRAAALSLRVQAHLAAHQPAHLPVLPPFPTPLRALSASDSPSLPARCLATPVSLGDEPYPHARACSSRCSPTSLRPREPCRRRSAE